MPRAGFPSLILTVLPACQAALGDAPCHCRNVGAAGGLGAEPWDLLGGANLGQQMSLCLQNTDLEVPGVLSDPVGKGKKERGQKLC